MQLGRWDAIEIGEAYAYVLAFEVPELDVEEELLQVKITGSWSLAIQIRSDFVLPSNDAVARSFVAHNTMTIY